MFLFRCFLATVTISYEMADSTFDCLGVLSKNQEIGQSMSKSNTS